MAFLHGFMVVLFVDRFRFVFVFAILFCQCHAAFWSPAGRGVIFPGAFVTFPYSILGQVWYLIVSIPDICLLPSFGLQCNSVLFSGHNHVLFI